MFQFFSIIYFNSFLSLSPLFTHWNLSACQPWAQPQTPCMHRSLVAGSPLVWQSLSLLQNHVRQRNLPCALTIMVPSGQTQWSRTQNAVCVRSFSHWSSLSQGGPLVSSVELFWERFSISVWFDFELAAVLEVTRKLSSTKIIEICGFIFSLFCSIRF